MCGNLRRTLGAFLAAVMLLASFPAYAVEEREEDGVSAEAVEEALPGEESREELELPAEAAEEVPPEIPEEAGPPVTLSVEPGSGTWGDLSWTLDSEGTLTISGTGAMRSNPPWNWNSDIKRAVIESGVTSIGWSAFSGCTGLTSITIPEGVVSIDSYAFEGCTGLAGVTIPESVALINGYAFENCVGLTGIAIPKKVSSIREGTFYGCAGLNGITIPEDVTSIGWRAFSGCSGLASITIPESVTSIGDEAFRGCTGLTSITIPKNVTSIGYEAFSGCTGLTSVTIPESVTEIGSSAFSGCTGLKTAGPIGSGSGYQFGWTSAIPDDAFKGCTGLTSVTIPGSVTSIGGGAFQGCTGLTSITVPESVTEIGYYTFSGCTGLETAGPIGSGSGYQFGWTSAIPDYAFKGCSGLTSVTIPASVTEIGSSAFSGCTGLETAGPIGSGSGYEFGWTVAIPEYAFKGCTGLTSVTLPENLASICRGAFSGCEKLKSITIPASVEKIESGAFSGCTSLTSAGPIGGDYGYQFGWTAAIPENTFYNCSSLTSVTIPGGVTSIGSYAFKGCTGLSGITIPDSVTSIGSSAFSGCTGLTDIAIPDGVTLIDWGTFSDCSGLTGISIPENITSIRGKAFSGCTGLTRITIPRNVTSIASDAFSGCSSLTAIEVSGENMTYSSVNGVLFNNNNRKIALVAYPIGRQGGYDIPEGVTSISGKAFAGCTGLTRITIPESVTLIGDGAFSGCTGLTSAGPIGGGYDYQFGWTTAIPSYAFAGCTGLTSIIIPESVTSVGFSALSGCSGLTSAGPIGSGCDYQFGWTTAIPDHAFHNCHSLTTVTLPESVTSIGSSAFSGCGNLTSLTIPKGVTSIASWTFYMSGLTDIDIPKGVISIGDLAFHACSYLTSVVIPEGVSSIGSSAFGSCWNLASVTIPDSVTSIGYAAFEYCSPDLCIYCYPGSRAESYAVENNLHYALLRRGDGDVSTWLSVNAPSGVTAGETFLVRTGYSALNAARLELDLPEEAVLSSLWLDGRELSAGDYTRGGNSLAVPVSGLADAPAHTLYLYCAASSAGSYSIGGRLVMVNGETHTLGAAAVRVSDAWLSVPERVGYPKGILATGKTGPGRKVTLFVDGVQAGAATSNSAGSWRIPFDLTAAGDHTVYAEIALPEGGTARTAEARVEYLPCAVYPLSLTMYNTGDHGAQTTAFDFTDPDAANLIRYYRIWPSRFPSFTFKAEFSGDPSTLSGVSVVTVNGAGAETVIPAAYDEYSRAWVASHEYGEFENAPVWVYVSYSGVCSGRLSAVPIMDPSGYVYEAVPSNRLAGVTAEIYYQDGGGEVRWNAAGFDQLNPQTTGPDGSYYWDVPAGNWKVKFTKDGYGSAETDWLPVPPPQVGINVPMASAAKPEVRCAAVYGDHAEVTFSQYMDIDSVKSAIALNGSAPASVEALDAEDSGSNAVQYATRFKAVAAEGLSGSAQLSVSAEARNYAGAKLAAAYAESLPVEVRPTEIAAPERVDMEMSGQRDIRVTLEPGVSGRELTVENLTPAILRTGGTSVTTGDGGGAEIPVEALLPGTGILRISEAASGLAADVTVQVKAAVEPEVSIEASVADGVLKYSVRNAPGQMNAKLLAAGYDGGRMSGAAILEGLSGTWALPDTPSGSYVLFLLDAGTWRPLCPRAAVSGR